MYQIIRKKTAMRLRMAILLMATAFALVCLAGCNAEKSGESKTESGEKESKTESGEVTASGRGLKVAVVNVGVEIKGGKSGIEILAEEYSKTHPDTPMTLVTFGEGNTISMDVAMAKLSAEIVGDDPPDLIFLQNITDRLDALASQGYLEDLTPYAEKSESVHLEDYYPKVLECGRKGGILACIPKSFTIETLVTSKNYFGDAKTWTYSELLDFCNAYPNSRFLHCIMPEMVFGSVLKESVEYFIDEDQRKCHFDSEEFRAFLEYAGSYSAWAGRTFDPIDPEDYASSLRDGKVLAMHFGFSHLRNLKVVRTDFGDAANFVGFPNKDGKPVYKVRLEASFSPFAITATSGNKEEAFRFIEWYLDLDEWPDGLHFDTLPLCANRKKMEEKIEKALAGREGVNDGEPEMTEEDLETLEILLEGLEPLSTYNDPLYKIVYTEARTYFSGSKTLDEVIDVIQSRATLYLQEK